MFESRFLTVRYFCRLPPLQAHVDRTFALIYLEPETPTVRACGMRSAVPGATASGSLEAFVLHFRTPSAAAAALRAESFNSELKGTSTMRAD